MVGDEGHGMGEYFLKYNKIEYYIGYACGTTEEPHEFHDSRQCSVQKTFPFD